MNSRFFPFFLLAALTACGGGGGGGGSTGGTTPIQPPSAPAATPSPQNSGIIAACGGTQSARLDVQLPGAGFEAALFVSTSQATVYAGVPTQAPIAASPVLVNGLTDGTDTFFGLAMRATGSSTWTPIGTVVRTRPGAPLYVDASAPATGANGQTPATAFPNLQDALLMAGAANGGNVWVRNGDYGAGPYALGPNVHAAGGFDGTFTLAARNVGAAATRLVGTATQEIVSVQCGGSDGSLDGFVIDGGTTALKGIDIVDSDVQLRSLTVRRCTDRGIKAATTLPQPNRQLTLTSCAITENGSDGLSSAGPIDLRLDLSRFDANGQEGADIDNLEAPDGGSVALHVTGCRFYGNGFEGLDADLAAAPLAAGNGSFDVHVENCRFEVNGLDGLLLDQEHEFFPGFRAKIVVRGCVARANRLAGVHIDADANGTYALDRLRCTANITDGVLITSETNAGEIVLLTSWLAGNLGHGARVASGNKVLLASHCGFAGNQVGGLRGEVRQLAAANCVFLGQGAPRTNALGEGNVDLAANSGAFLLAPVAFTTVSAMNQGTLTVTSATGFGTGTHVVAGDDARALLVNQGSGTTLVLDATPQAFTAPGSLTAYASSSVADDLRLAAASPAANAGIAPTGTTAPDAGPFGAVGGGEPGRSDPFASSTLRLFGMAPPQAIGVTALQAIVLTFDRAVDASSVTADRVVALRGATALTVNLSVSGNTVTLAPTGTGWSGAVSLRLQGGLRGLDGSSLAAPLVIPVRVL